MKRMRAEPHAAPENNHDTRERQLQPSPTAFTRFLFAALCFAAATHTAAADLRIGLSADVTSMDPHFLNISPNNNVGWHVFEALTHVDENTRLIPGLATAWRAVNPTTWEFTLRRGVKFHDGSDLTADDVVFSIERAAKLPNGQYASFVQRLTEKTAVDAHTLRVRTATPYAMVPYDLNSIFVVSKKAAANAATEDFNSGKAMIGTGPFRFVRFARGDRVELARNERWWGAGDNKTAAWDKVTFRIMPTDPTRLAALLAGDVDMVEQIPTADLARVRVNTKFQTAQKVSWRTIFFHLDQSRDRAPSLTDRAGKPLEKNPFKDARVRMAISKAINRQAIVERVMEGGATPASNLVSPPVFGHAGALKPEAFDVEGAKKLLAEAGYPNGFAMTLHAPNNRYVNDDQIAQVVAQMLARAGIQAKVEALPINAYLPKARNGDFSFAMLGWGSFSADLALRSLLATPDKDKGYGTWNWSNYSNAKVDQLLDQAFATVDDKRREEIAREAMQLAMRDVAVIPLHHQLVTWAMRRPLTYVARTDEYTFAHHVRQ
ncbi:MAG: ABC transporter substrate-binding protein [Betaproteobacteria bacterium]|nr:ABC transporter substrate-binding protein [Betaproteobacteria bacterium]